MENRPIPQFLIGAAVAIGALAGIVAYDRHTTLIAAKLEMAIARMPLGISVTEADLMIGDSPDRVSLQFGTLATPVTMLAASNPKAGAYGPPKKYAMRTWRRGNVNATVAIDANGNVAGRWVWR